ncbi:MAG TPA: hypothetical protein VF490_21085 [Chryseosolibacter sp.]
MKKVFKIGCLVSLAVFAGVILLAIFEPDALRERRLRVEKEGRDSARYYLDEVRNRMIRVREKLPALTPESEPAPFPLRTLQWNETLQTSADEVNRFTDNGFAVSPPIPYGPWLSKLMQDIERAYHEPEEEWKTYEITKAGRSILNFDFLMVYSPLNHIEPRLVDKETFQPGYFDGWMIFVDFKNGTPLGYARFQSATTLYNVEYHQLGIGIGPIPVSIPLFKTTDVQKELTDDFRNEFFRKTDSTFMAFKRQ